jgi:hypothetical protein
VVNILKLVFGDECVHSFLSSFLFGENLTNEKSTSKAAYVPDLNQSFNSALQPLIYNENFESLMFGDWLLEIF